MTPLEILHMDEHPITRFGESPPIDLIHRHEGRNVELLVELEGLWHRETSM